MGWSRDGVRARGAKVVVLAVLACVPTSGAAIAQTPDPAPPSSGAPDPAPAAQPPPAPPAQSPPAPVRQTAPVATAVPPPTPTTVATAAPPRTARPTPRAHARQRRTPKKIVVPARPRASRDAVSPPVPKDLFEPAPSPPPPRRAVRAAVRDRDPLIIGGALAMLAVATSTVLLLAQANRVRRELLTG